jgi:polyisoprenoid-binding protein YceI
MKKYILIITALICLAGFASATPSRTGFINIIVESNVNKVLFTYPLNEVDLQNQSVLFRDNENEEAAKIVVPVKDFKCSNKLAFNDFLNLLRANQYPEITISIPQRFLKNLDRDKTSVLKNVEITIAGQTRKYNIQCKTENSGDEGLKLIGSVKIDLRDLQIKPPVKYFGMVRIKDEVIVNFGIGIKDQNLAFKN